MKDTTGSPNATAQRWRRIVDGLTEESATLPPDERRWMEERIERIGALQEKMHQIFLSADGVRLCGDCLGECCGCGKNHVTLANLLAFLLRGEEPPLPDFSLTCPYLGAEGCSFEPSRRPFNCVSFLCGPMEERLAPEALASFYRFETELRTLYLEFDKRYAGSSLRGILIRAERLAGRPFLSRI